MKIRLTAAIGVIATTAALVLAASPLATAAPLLPSDTTTSTSTSTTTTTTPPPDTLMIAPVTSSELSFHVANLTPACVSDSVLTVMSGGTEVVPIAKSEIDPDTFAVTIPPATPSPVTFQIQCLDVSQQLSTTQGDEFFATIAVTKAVEGSAPAGATFTVNASCVVANVQDGVGVGSFLSPTLLAPEFTVDLPFTVAGGIGYVHTFTPYDCTFTETITGGATTSTVTPALVTTIDPIRYDVAVVNTFPAAPTFTG